MYTDISLMNRMKEKLSILQGDLKKYAMKKIKQ
jgi:hypothetical protein